MLSAQMHRHAEPKNVTTLACAGEIGRALASIVPKPRVQCTTAIVNKIQALYPARSAPPESGRPNGQGAGLPQPDNVQDADVQRVAAKVPFVFKRMPKLSEPGPLGMRREHWGK